MRFTFLLAIILHFNFCLSGQNTVEDPSDLILLLNQNKIISNKITSVKASISYKYDLEVIHQTREKIVIEFDKIGLIKTIIEIKTNKNREDSIVTTFIRNKYGQALVKIKSDALYTYVEIMNYNNDLLIDHQYYQMKKTSDWNNNLYDKYLMWSDSIFYNENKIVIYNKYGNIYRNHQIDRNEKNQIIKNGYYDQSGRWFKTILYDYNSNFLTEMKELNSKPMMFNWTKKYEYNENDLLKIEYYKNNEIVYIRRLTYNSNGLLELDLKRNETTKKMTIIQFEYYH